MITDSRGRLVAAGVSHASLKGSVNLAEAEVVQWGIKVAREAALNSVIIETACLEVAELIDETRGSRTKIFWTISDIRNQSKQFQSVAVKHVSRNCNAYAYSLVKFALENNSPNIWVNSIPAEVQLYLQCCYE